MRTWFITGASGGLGRGIAEAVLMKGDQAVLVSRTPEKLCDFPSRFPDRTLLLSVRLSDHESLKEAVGSAIKAFGSIDVLVNNAGHGYRAAIEESEDLAVRELFDIDFFAPMDLVKLVLPEMRKRRSGIIINVSSIGAVRGALGNGYYSGAKAALEMASEALGKEVEHLGIRVMLAEPGAFRTGFYGDDLRASAIRIEDYDDIAQYYRKPAEIVHDQIGDPLKGGRLIVEAALSENPPFRLLLGRDAVIEAETVLAARLEELREWKDISVRSGYRDGER